MEQTSQGTRPNGPPTAAEAQTYEIGGKQFRTWASPRKSCTPEKIIASNEVIQMVNSQNFQYKFTLLDPRPNGKAEKENFRRGICRILERIWNNVNQEKELFDLFNTQLRMLAALEPGRVPPSLKSTMLDLRTKMADQLQSHNQEGAQLDRFFARFLDVRGDWREIRYGDVMALQELSEEWNCDLMDLQSVTHEASEEE